MPKMQTNRQQVDLEKVDVGDTSLKGTLISVFFVLVVIVVFWGGVYAIFSSRF